MTAGLYSSSLTARLAHLCDSVIGLEAVRDDSDIVRLIPEPARYSPVVVTQTYHVCILQSVPPASADSLLWCQQMTASCVVNKSTSSCKAVPAAYCCMKEFSFSKPMMKTNGDACSCCGLLHLQKLPSLNALGPPIPDTTLFIIRHKRRRLTIQV